MLEPAQEFAKLAIANIETRNLTQAVVESWKPVVANALSEWARQRMLTVALTTPLAPQPEAKVNALKTETTSEELQAFETTKEILGPECVIGYEDSAAYFKVYLAGKRTWVFVRFQIGKRQTNVWVPLPQAQAVALTPGRSVTVQSGWSVIALELGAPLTEVADVLRAAFVYVKQSKESGASGDDSAAP